MRQENPFKVGYKVQIVRDGKTDECYSLTSYMKRQIGNKKEYTISVVDRELINLKEDSRFNWHYTSFELSEHQDVDNQI